MEPEHKNCRWCAQEIPSAARRCPYCTTMQGASWLTLLALAPVLALVLFFLWFNSQFRRASPNFADDVSIVESKMVFGEHDASLTASVVGVLQSSAERPLDDLQIEAQFLNEIGELIDVGTGRVGLLDAKSQVAFKVYTYASSPKEDYATFEV